MNKRNSYYEMNRDVFKNFVARGRESVKSVGEAFRKKHVFISQGNKKVGDIPSVSLFPVIDCGNCHMCKFSCYDLRRFSANDHSVKSNGSQVGIWYGVHTRKTEKYIS